MAGLVDTQGESHFSVSAATGRMNPSSLTEVDTLSSNGLRLIVPGLQDAHGAHQQGLCAENEWFKCKCVSLPDLGELVEFGSFYFLAPVFLTQIFCLLIVVGDFSVVWFQC